MILTSMGAVTVCWDTKHTPGLPAAERTADTSRRNASLSSEWYTFNAISAPAELLTLQTLLCLLCEIISAWKELIEMVWFELW